MRKNAEDRLAEDGDDEEDGDGDGSGYTMNIKEGSKSNRRSLGFQENSSFVIERERTKTYVESNSSGHYTGGSLMR